MSKFQPFKSCRCKGCKGSKQRMSNRGYRVRYEKTRLHRLFRRSGKHIDMDYDLPGFMSGGYWC